MRRWFFRVAAWLCGCFSTISVHAQGVHDYSVAEVLQLQQPGEVLKDLPKQIDGRPDWVQALRRGLVQPRETLLGSPRPAEDMGAAPEGGIVFRNTQFMPFVVFPHRAHAEWLACSNCHDHLFPRQATGKGIGMTAILQGAYCGVCHGRVAFTPEGSCYRCHSMPNPAAAKEGSAFAVPITKIEQAPEPSDGDGERRRRKISPGGMLPGGLRPAPGVN